MNDDGPDFRNIEEILAQHAELARELEGVIGGAEERVEPAAEVVETFRLRVEDYLQRVARSGVWLHCDTDRVSAVGRLSGWVNELYRLGCYRGGVRPPSVQLAPFAPDLQAELRDEDFPYAARGGAGASFGQRVNLQLLTTEFGLIVGVVRHHFRKQRIEPLKLIKLQRLSVSFLDLVSKNSIGQWKVLGRMGLITVRYPARMIEYGLSHDMVKAPTHTTESTSGT